MKSVCKLVYLFGSICYQDIITHRYNDASFYINASRLLFTGPESVLLLTVHIVAVCMLAATVAKAGFMGPVLEYVPRTFQA